VTAERVGDVVIWSVPIDISIANWFAKLGNGYGNHVIAVQARSRDLVIAAMRSRLAGIESALP